MSIECVETHATLITLPLQLVVLNRIIKLKIAIHYYMSRRYTIKWCIFGEIYEIALTVLFYMNNCVVRIVTYLSF